MQLLSFIFSFGYGIIVSYFYNLNYNFIYKSSILYKIVINFLFCINMGLIYFLLMRVINNGVIHIYFVISFLISFVLFSGKYKYLRKLINEPKKNKLDSSQNEEMIRFLEKQKREIENKINELKNQ